MKRFPRILSLLLVLCMILSMLPTAVFAEETEATEGHFTDVPVGEWYYEYVEAAYEAGLIDGYKDGTFLPQKSLTRAEAATLLYRLEGSPEVEATASFTDLVNGWYDEAIAWAEETGIVNGFSDGTFRPDESVTREQFVTMVWRLNGEPEATGTLEGFVDADAVQEYARTAFAWAVENGIINGLTSYQWEGTRLAPQDNIKRCEAAKILVVLTADKTITILYTNDVHTYINKTLSYDTIAAMKDEYEAAGKNVLLVDAGDHIQGTAYGGLDKGENIMALMVSAGYDLATLGNHEFDYGMERALEVSNAAKNGGIPYISANFYHEENGVAGDPVLEAYKIFEFDGVKVAFVGITTPESFTKSTPAYFQDENGNYIYGIAGGTDGAELYASVQTAIDDAIAEGADYVIALGHLGVDPSSTPWTSEELIANTTGLDAFIDGHSHTTVEGREVLNKDGETVLLTQTGSYFDAIGKMTIAADGTITTELITEYEGSDEPTKAIQDAWMTSVDEQLGEKIAESDILFTDKDADGNRAVRKYETNMGNLNADAYYWFLDEASTGVQVTIMNGGGIRSSAAAGDWTYLTCKTINTFGNVLCAMEVTGQQIVDALEWGARTTPVAECGGFLHTSGLTYEVDSTIESTVQYDEKGVWTGGPTGEYRVKNVKVYNKETNTYEPIDLEATYVLGGTNYTLRDLGDGFAMFEGANLVLDYVSEDYLAMAAYVSAFKDTDGNGYGNIATVNSPLYEKYPNFMINYESATGAGRITVIEGETEEWDGVITIGGLEPNLWTTKYGNIYTDASAENIFEDLGFNYGDLITVKFLDQELVLPLVSNFSDVDSGTAALFVAKNELGNPTGYAYLAINMGNFTDAYGIATKKTDADGNWYWEAKEGVEFPIELTFELKEAGGYMAEYLLHQLSRTNNREDYPELTDEQFANFREVTTTGMGAGKLYRSSSPINPELGRNAIADAAAEKAGVKTFVNLANNQADAEAYEGYSDTYYSKQNVVFLNLGVDFNEQSFKDGLATGFRFMIANEGPYLIHCTEGKDRAGYVTALLECLMGATYEEVVADYMTTYINYYKVELGSEQYNAIAESNIIKSLARAFGVEDLSTADLQAGAEAYLKEIGLTDEEIATLKANLGGSDDETVEFEFLVTSDMHGKIFATDYSSGYEASGTYRQGLTRIATYIKEQREIYGENLYLVDMGDTFQGEPLTYYYSFNADDLDEVDPAILALRTLGYNMWLLGNHEFNYGLNILKRQMAEAVAPATETESQLVITGANYLDATTNSDEEKSWDCVENIVPYVIQDFDGVKVAIIGLSTPNIPKWDGPQNWEGFYFESIYTTYKHYEAEMLEQADMIVVMAHCGLNAEMADESYDGVRYLIEHTNTIDFAFSGHAHGTQDNVILNSDGEEVHVLQPGTKAALISRVTVTYNKTTGEYTLDTKNEDMKNYALDEETVELLQPYETYVWENYMLQKIGEADGDFTASGLGTGPSAFVDLVNKVQLWGAYDSTGLNTPDDPSDDTMAMLSITAPLTSGNNANVISEGDIMLGDLFALYRYENWFYQLTMTGKEVRTWLEYSATKLVVGSDGTVSVMGGLTYYDVIGGEGFSYIIDPTLPEGERVVSMTYNGKEVADDFEFTIVMNNYRFTGGGNYVKYCNEHGCDLSDLESRIIYSTQYDMIQGEDLGQARALLQAYITEQGTISPEITSTWSVQPNYVAPAEDDNVYKLATELKDGDQVVIVCAAKNVALSAEYTGYYNSPATVNPVNGTLTDPDTALVWTVGKTGDTYTFSYNGQKLGMQSSFSSMPLGAENDTWNLVAAQTENCFYVYNVGRQVYIEYFESKGYWSGFYNNSVEELFALQFYVKGA